MSKGIVYILCVGPFAHFFSCLNLCGAIWGDGIKYILNMTDAIALSVFDLLNLINRAQLMMSFTLNYFLDR